ncbi:hypothetical protein [Mycobacterium sp. M23085]|uniref:hypothetical protein n=1 Tax=Mycobacterium sp. M23085 TaxID=3378087 RepID=UPI003877922A
MSGRVYLLGAGFSMAISSDAPVESKMPDMRGLSEAVIAKFRHEVPLVRHAGSVDTSSMVSEGYRQAAEFLIREGKFKDLSDAMRDWAILHLIPGFATPLVNNFEQWLSFLIESPPWLPLAEQARNRSAFLYIADAIATTLRRRQQMTVESHKGNCPVWLSHLVDLWERHSAKVITFNYDQLVELAWLSARNIQNRARSVDLYPAPLTPLIARTGAIPPAPAVSGGFELLKLHGSIGWWYSGPDGPPGDVVYDQGIKGFAWSREGLEPDQETTTRLAADRVPMIVPPAAVKSPYYNNSILRALWKSAADALNSADEVVLMGFSLPQTDMLVSSMLCTNVPRHCKITPVNPYPDIIDRICATFGIEPDDERLNKDYLGTDDQPMWDAIPKWIDDWYVRW